MHITEHASPGGISIHALLAESDIQLAAHANASRVISIHALLAESDGWVLRYGTWTPSISIHALLAESDHQVSD